MTLQILPILSFSSFLSLSDSFVRIWKKLKSHASEKGHITILFCIFPFLLKSHHGGGIRLFLLYPGSISFIIHKRIGSWTTEFINGFNCDDHWFDPPLKRLLYFYAWLNRFVFWSMWSVKAFCLASSLHTSINIMHESFFVNR